MSDKELVTIDVVKKNALEAFTGKNDLLERLYLHVEHEALSIVQGDPSTDKGRKQIISTAAKVAKDKVAVEELGKQLAAEQKEIPKKIDAARKLSRERFEALKELIRKPVTDYEAEQRRIAEEQAEAERLQKQRLTDEQIERERLEREELEQEKQKLANERAAFEAEQKRVKDLAETAERERLKRIADEELERNRLIVQQAREEQIKADAEKRLAEQTIIAEQERQRQAKLAEQELQSAVLAEQKRIADIAEAERKKAEVLAANKAHRATINNEIKDLLMANNFTEEQAVWIIKLAVNGKVGNLIIKY